MIDELLMPRTTEETIPQQYRTARRKPLPDLGGAATSDKVALSGAERPDAGTSQEGNRPRNPPGGKPMRLRSAEQAA